MARRQWIQIAPALAIGLCLWALLAGCSPKNDAISSFSPTELTKTPADQYAALQKFSRGVALGPKFSDYTVYIMFDPQCLHCARLWEESKELTATIKFVWVPVNFVDANSMAQSALLLSSTSPREDMDRVMAQVLAHSAATTPAQPVPPYLEATIKSNTELINRFHVLAVPYVVARNQTSSQYIARQGGMSKETLKRFLGVGSR